MPSVTGIPSFNPRTNLASWGAAKPCVATNSPDSVSSRLRLVKTAIWASMSFLDHCRYESTPALLPDISKMYFISLAPFTLPSGRVHEVVGAASRFSTCSGQMFFTKKVAVRCRFEASCSDLSTEAQKDDYRIRRSGRQPGLGGGMRPAGTIHGNPVR